jgi:hypothetical protein
MALTTLDQLLVSAARQTVSYKKTAAITTVATAWFSLFAVAGSPGAGTLTIGNTTAGAVPDDTTAGFPLISAFGGGAEGAIGVVSWGNTVATRLKLLDRVYHVGSVSCTALATTTLAAQPSYAARLPSANYALAQIFLEVNAAVSATATTVTVTYTNQAGTTGRSTGAVSITSLTTARVLALPLQAGDSGVQKIETIVIGGTVATTGSINVVVARALWSNKVRVTNDGGTDGPDLTMGNRVIDTVALWMITAPDSTSSGLPDCDITIVNN